MPARARNEIIDETQPGFYHCYSRCVRRAFLCGTDHYSGRNYDHRKQWVEERLQFLASCMAVELSSFAVMDNHLHTVLRNRPDLVSSWSDEEVARRWLTICPGKREKNASLEQPEGPSQEKIQALVKDRGKLAKVRGRLSSISWYMKFLKEHISRKANEEDGCRGTFWEARFRSTRLLDTCALLLCTMYVDLNLIRAGIALTPESSRHTSACLRIQARGAGNREAAAWLSPIDEAGNPPDGQQAAAGRRASDDGFLPLTRDQYLQLLDWSGRQIRQDKKGAIPAELAPILERLEMDADQWLIGVQCFGACYSDAAGTRQSLQQHAASQGRHWYRGMDATQRRN